MTRPLKSLLVIGVLFSTSCTSQKEIVEAPGIPETPEVPEMVEEIIPPYNPSRERLFNLVHTSLDVNFDLKKQYMNGSAELTLHPYFYPQSQLVLDALGFDLNAVGLVYNGHRTELKYDYDHSQILIHLDKEYTMTDTVKIFIDYVAKPEELVTEKGTAITDAKGLYFIDPLDEDPTKPTQIWTQGETQASSAWFPTIDAPNENTTQDITITVEDRFTTLSNGVRISSTKNEDGTRTDKWVQNEPHAPYLVMMAVGEFAEIKDSWNELEVNYYVEPKYEEHADDIFGNTPEMLTYYSELLNYPYPWEKYSQVVVRDYVSGAMENTSAVIHGEFLQQTERELLDHNNEDVIAHELFHHWFGDLVTCESWANLPINESFATYGENLWREHKYGRFSADDHGNAQLRTYLMESKRKQVNMIRFHYEEKDDMFDAHSYHKGGRILHMLRIHLGDDAFFKALEIYLKENAHRAVEMHEFRLACEKVSGQDLNWFFNQWFYASGHPKLDIRHDNFPDQKEYHVTVSQNQNLETTPLYKLPITVDLYLPTGVKRKIVWLDSVQQTFVFKVNHEPMLVNVDAEKALLCEKTEELSDRERMHQLKNAPLLMDKLEALKALSGSSDSLTQAAIFAQLDHEYWKVKTRSLTALKKAYPVRNREVVISKVHEMMMNDEKSAVRAAAIAFLQKVDPESISAKDLETMLKDRSYKVSAKALEILGEQNSVKALEIAKSLEDEAEGSQLIGIATLYSKYGTNENAEFMKSALSRVGGFNDKYVMVQLFGKYLLRQNAETQSSNLETLRSLAIDHSAWYIRVSAIQVLAEMIFVHRENTGLSSKLDEIMREVKAKETDPQVRGMLGE